MSRDIIDAKTKVANEVLSSLTPHMTTQLGGNLGYGVNTMGGDLVPQASDAIKLWVESGRSSKLIATIMTAAALMVITEQQADELIDKIKAVDKKAG